MAPAGCGAVVKADAYGLGAARVIPALYEAGCRSFFVATQEEAKAAIALAPGATIYVLDGILPGCARELAALGAASRAWRASRKRAPGRRWRPADAPTPPAALHVDTGLNRLGMGEADFAALLADTGLLRRLDIALIISHLACADDAHHAMNREQLATFKRLRAQLPKARASLAASDGLMLGKEFHFDLVRPGYALYGGQAAAQRAPVQPVVRVSARILQVQDVPAGGRVGYSATYRAASPRRIATIAAGYADGVFRHASASDGETGGAVVIRGKLAPIVGRVSMDLITVDITDIGDPAPVRGDFVDLIGPESAARSRRPRRQEHRL